MNYMLCRNRVRNFDQWKRVFDSHADNHRTAGLKLVHLWQEMDSLRNVFFLFEIEDIARAREFLESADAASSARESGLIEGDFHFFSQSLGYGDKGEVESPPLPAASEELAFTNPVTISEPAEPVDSSAPPEPAKSSEAAEPAKRSVIPEPAKSTERVKSSTPPEAMKGPERVKSAPPLEHVDGWEPVENWPPAEAAAQPAEQPPQHHRRFARSKY